MAKAKAKSKAKQNMLPSGFKPIDPIGAFWSGREPGDKFEGTLVSVKTKHFEKNGKYAARDANVYTFKSKDGGKPVEITQSGGLGALQQVKKGQQVCIVFVGMKKLKGKADMREYQVGVK